MRASQAAAAHAPLPLPLPLPLPPPPLSLPSPPAAPRRGRHRTSSASSSSCSSSSSSAASSSFSCPSPSPAASPPRASLVPFSWERHPGVPKTSSSGGSLGSPAPLPLPPPLLDPAPRRRRRRRANASAVATTSSSSVHGSNSSDPFVAAFAECTREEGDVDSADHGADVAVAENKLWLARRTKPAASSGRRWRITGGGGGLVAFLDLYGCKSAMAVADGALLARRPPVVAHGRRGSRR